MQQISSDLRCCRAPAASLRPAIRVHRNVDVLRGAAVQRSAAPSTARRCVNSPQGAPGPPLASAPDQVLLHLQVPPGCHPGRGRARQGLPLQQRLQCRQRPGCGRGCGAAGRAVLGKGAPNAAAFWCAARAAAAAGGGASVAKEGGPPGRRLGAPVLLPPPCLLRSLLGGTLPAGVILGGGAGSRLYPLTKVCAGAGWCLAEPLSVAPA